MELKLFNKIENPIILYFKLYKKRVIINIFKFIQLHVHIDFTKGNRKDCLSIFISLRQCDMNWNDLSKAVLLVKIPYHKQ